MIRLFYSDRASELVEALTERLRQSRADGQVHPFDPVPLIVPDQASAAYLKMALAQTLMITVFGVSYMIILMIMCFCRNNDTLRVPFLLFISFFIGLISGFMVGVNLKMVIERLKD